MLYLVATPLGNIQDITLRSLEILKSCDVILCESTKEASKLLKAHGLKAQRYEVLNEHTTAADLPALVELCEKMQVALVSDCGTPGFCDPGADLVKLCAQKKIPVTSLPGPSALMGILSLSGLQLQTFYFRGFLPAENEARAQAWTELKKRKEITLLMDTPYRLKKLLSEVETHWPQAQCVLALNLTAPDEVVLRGTMSSILKQLRLEKAEFMLLVKP